MNVGLVAMSAKPFHYAHMNIIKRAASENDTVKLYVSLSDRKRKNEVSIYGHDMQLVWEKYLLNLMPANVKVMFGGSPVGNIYKTIGKAEENNDTKTIFTIYAGEDDIERNYKNSDMLKYFPALSQNNQIKKSKMQREFSGTQMRKYLHTGNKNAFIESLPKMSNHAANNIWVLLHSRIRTESIVQQYINLLS